MNKLEIKYVSIDDVVPYENNPRHNEEAIPLVANSIREFGFRNPIILDKENVIVAGHTRLEAAKRLNLKEVPVLYADDLTEEQIKAFRIADNKVTEAASWNSDLLALELEGITNIDMDQFGFGIIEETESEENPYSQKVKIPQYEIEGETPALNDLYDNAKTLELIREIENSNVTDDEKEFLKNAAYRHIVFNYKMIAEYYANASQEMQDLMEKSALVIIDLGDAIANGYAQMVDKLKEMVDEDE